MLLLFFHYAEGVFSCHPRKKKKSDFFDIIFDKTILSVGVFLYSPPYLEIANDFLKIQFPNNSLVFTIFLQKPQ